jgi:hypothetical protein
VKGRLDHEDGAVPAPAAGTPQPRSAMGTTFRGSGPL